LLTYAGKGDGTFRSPSFYKATSTSIWSMAVGDFDGDVRPDLFLGQDGYFQSLKGLCGTGVHIYTPYPVISLGQTAPLHAFVSGLAPTTPLPRGTATFREGTTRLGTADVDATRP